MCRLDVRAPVILRAGVDPVLVPLLVNLLSSVIWEVVRDPLFGEGLGAEKPDHFNEAVEDALERLAPALRGVDEQSRSDVVAFLESAETRGIVSQLYRTRFSDARQSLAELRQAFSTVWGTKHPQHVRAIAAYDLFDALVDTCDQILEQAIANGYLGAHESRSAARHHELASRLSAIERSVGALRAADQPSLEALSQFESRLRSHLIDAYASVTPPSVKGEREVPMDSVYVAPLFSVGPLDSADQRAGALELETVVRQAHRLVVLGDPGAGKSTFARHLCLELARDHQRLAGGAKGLGIFVELREYVRRRDSGEIALTEYIEQFMRSRFSLDPPSSAIEYLLEAGRLSVIFDGLDELPVGTRRSGVRDAIEHFATRFPLAHIIVTSRRIGYEHASLDSARFQTVRLAPFDEPRVEEYALKWFSVNRPEDLHARDLAEAFCAESRVAADLRSNPLMLGLMCVLYNGQGWIPRNRPDLYGQCATYLFETWDKNRQIEVTRPFEDLLRPAMRRLAFWVYTTPELQRGISAELAVEKTTDFLVSQRYSDRLRAEQSARSFIEFCRGRAWVFSDIGSDRAGGDLFAFTHRTFLEFFAAEQVLNDYETTAQLLRVLRPKILGGEWEVVAQLAVHIKERRRLNSGDDILNDLLRRTEGHGGVRRQRALTFAARLLEGLALQPATVRRVVDGALSLLESVHRDTDSRGSAVGTPIEILSDLLLGDIENRQVVAEALNERVMTLLGSEDGHDRLLGSELATLDEDDLERLLPLSVAEQRSWWAMTFASIGEAARETILSLADNDGLVARDAVHRGWLRPAEYVRIFGAAALFVDRSLQISGSYRPSITEMVLEDQLGPDGAPELLSVLLGLERPWFARAPTDPGIQTRPWSWIFSGAPARHAAAVKALLILAVAEPAIDGSRYTDLAESVVRFFTDEFPDGDGDEVFAPGAAFWNSVRLAIETRLGYGDPETMDATFEPPLVEPAASELLRAWGRNEVRFVASPR